MGRNSETIKYHRMIDAGLEPTEKWCAACKSWQGLGNFGADKSRKDGRSNFCRPCARLRYTAWAKANPERMREITRRGVARRSKSKQQEAHRKHRYGMEAGQYDRMLAAQGGRCAICDRTPAKPLIVDHDHGTGEVRGLLCYSCNIGLHMLEAPGRLDAAIQYLGRLV